MEKKKTYIAIDLKSFFASVECVSRGLDPLTTNLLVADVSKTEKTICTVDKDKCPRYNTPIKRRGAENISSREENAETFR